MKRARERDYDETEPQSLEDNNINYNAKKRDLYGINQVKENQQKDVESEKASSKPWDSHLALGVFDFPWLKDGVMSKTEDCFLDFDDKFSSSLEHQDGGFNFSEAYCYSETPETSKKEMETVWQPFESDGLEIKAEDVDCIWSSVINKNNHEGKLLM